MHLWHDLTPGRDPPHDVRAIVEIPGGSRNKYELDKESGLLRLDRVLYSAVHYPADYGFIPGTLAEDDDPMDILILLKDVKCALLEMSAMHPSRERIHKPPLGKPRCRATTRDQDAGRRC